MFLKIMSADDADDGDTRKTFRLFDGVAFVTFTRVKDEARAHARFDNGIDEDFVCEGNAYLMNDQGKTVASFGVSPYHR